MVFVVIVYYILFVLVVLVCSWESLVILPQSIAFVLVIFAHVDYQQNFLRDRLWKHLIKVESQNRLLDIGHP
jgi:hypothetical protein